MVVMDHGVIEQIGTPEQVYMEPATPFVANFVGETNHLPDGLHVRPHDIAIVPDGGESVLVDNVFRKGGFWRVEGKPLNAADQIIEIDLDAGAPAPAIGDTVLIRAKRSKSFTQHGVQP